jgi:type II secretory pathway component PulK
LELLVKDETASDSPKDPWYQNGIIELKRDGFKITVLIEDEGSKPNLNTISDNSLLQIAQTSVSNSGLQQNTQISIDPLLDWRDIDSEPRPEGAELTYYQSLNPSYKPRDGCFSSLEEIKLVKNGNKLYPLLAPKVTIFGMINPNPISGETFARILSSSGDFQKGWLDTVKDQFNSYRAAQRRFTKMDDFLQLFAITIGTLDKIKSLFQFDGRCNVNMATKNNLMVIIKEARYNDAAVAILVNHQKEQPFERIRDIYPILGYNEVQPQGKPNPDDYFTTVSTIIRYRIWVSKGSGQYYLDTVWERQLMGLKKEWQVNPLSWRELLNNTVPAIPQVENTDTSNDDSKKTEINDKDQKDDK